MKYLLAAALAVVLYGCATDDAVTESAYPTYDYFWRK